MNLEETLRGIVGDAHVLTDPASRAGYERDWTRRFHGRARCVVRPASAEETAAVVQACGDVGAPVVPQGGNTGLVGGGVPRDGEVLLSLTRLQRLDPVDRAAAQVTVGAGVPLAAVHAAARTAGLRFPVDLGARDSATIGGMIGTNAGGVHVLRFGPMRAQVRGVEAVLADGSIVRRLSGLEKDNVGYDLPGLLCGSEGTLGVVTAARLRLVPDPPWTVTVVVGLATMEEALEVLGRARTVPGLEAAEVWFGDGVALVAAHTGRRPPVDAPVVLLLEASGVEDPSAAMADAIGDVEPAAVATDRPGRERLWFFRHAHAEAVNASGIPRKYDVAVPLGHLAAFERDVRAHLHDAAPAALVTIWGHVGDGNLHVNVVGADEGVDAIVFALVASYAGSISAEHGVGVAKRAWLHLARDDADLAAMRAVKRALDPRDLLNPGVLFPP